MPLSKEQLDNWFTYHAPTEDTAPKYAAINAAFEATIDAIGGMSPDVQGAEAYAVVNATTRAFAEAIDANAPDCADKTAAIRCVRLVRNYMNEAITEGVREDGRALVPLVRAAVINIYAARFQANAAIACGGK